MKNVVGLFESIRDAEAVVRELRAAGISDADISFAGRNADAATMEANTYTTEGHSEAAEGAGFGATGGTIVGGLTGLLVGLGAITIPGVGPVIAAGTLATALGSAALGAGIGAAAGGLLGALVGAGIPEEDAHVYSEGIRRGGSLVMAQVSDNMVDTTLDIMERYNVVDIDERGAEYRRSGWTRFDENAETYAGTTGTGYTTMGDADRAVGQDDYDRSSKVGTVGGAVAGAATGAALGSAGGPVGTVVGGVAGAVTGGGVGAVGDAVGAEATDDDAGRRTDYGTTGTSYSSTGGTAYGSATDYGSTGSTMGDVTPRRRRSRMYEVGGTSTGSMTSEGPIENMASRIENATERGLGADLDRDGDVGRRDPRDNY
ncbi:MAG TPA: hypothetical protein VFZ66_10995 [Herpetosiphonaceae bacterium]